MIHIRITVAFVALSILLTATALPVPSLDALEAHHNVSSPQLRKLQDRQRGAQGPPPNQGPRGGQAQPPPPQGQTNRPPRPPPRERSLGQLLYRNERRQVGQEQPRPSGQQGTGENPRPLPPSPTPTPPARQPPAGNHGAAPGQQQPRSIGYLLSRQRQGGNGQGGQNGQNATPQGQNQGAQPSAPNLPPNPAPQPNPPRPADDNPAQNGNINTPAPNNNANGAPDGNRQRRRLVGAEEAIDLLAREINGNGHLPPSPPPIPSPTPPTRQGQEGGRNRN